MADAPFRKRALLTAIPTGGEEGSGATSLKSHSEVAGEGYHQEPWNTESPFALPPALTSMEDTMLKSAIVAASMVIATAAFAQSNMSGGAGKSEFAPGQQPNTTKGPGHSESAPGQQKNTAGPGYSAGAPGQQSTTGSAASDRTKKK
jgi:hypothetical protein